MKPYRVIVLPDLQIPFHDRRTLKAVEEFMADNVWDEWVQVGDFLDFPEISSFNKENLRELSGKRLMLDYSYGNEILDRHQQIIKKNNPRAKFTLLEGNHEYRIEKLIDASPQLEGLIEVEIGLHLKERGIKWVRYWRDGKLHKIGNAVFAHGLYTNLHHAKKMVENYGTNVFYGHTHDVQCFPKVLQGADKTIVGQSLGCLCKPQKYQRGKPDKWTQAFATFHFFPDGFFTYNIIHIFKHRFFINGKTYQG